MTELISPRESAMYILEQLKQTLSAIRIQRTWRSREDRINGFFEKERMISIHNKDENTIIIPDNYIEPYTSVPVKWTCSPNKFTAIIPDWNKMKSSTSTKTSRVSFNAFLKSRSHSGKNKAEETIVTDAIEKESHQFYHAIKSWITIPSNERNEDFFLTYGKSWMKSQVCTDRYMVLLEDAINNMKDKKIITLWGDRGKQIRLYPFLHVEIISDLHIMFRIHLNLVKLERLKKIQRERRNKMNKMNKMTLIPSTTHYVYNIT